MSLPLDLDKAKLRILLEDYAFERLDKEGAIELRPLLIRLEGHTNNAHDRKNIQKIINELDQYIKGKINLMRNIDVPISIA